MIDPAVIHAAAATGSHLYPYATYKPIPEAATQVKIEPWSFILHTMAGPGSTTPEQLWAYINRPDISGEPHLLLGYTTLIQAVPFNVRADNNAKANSWTESGKRVGAVSVETQDNGATADPGIARAPWNDYQVEHLAGIAAFLNLRYGIPLARCPQWNSRGVDGHRAHDEWSIYVGKTCPGQKRWETIPRILELAAEIVAWMPTPDPPEVVDPPEDVTVQYFTLAPQPATLWGTPDGLTAFRLEVDTAVARGINFGAVPVLTGAEAAKFVFVSGLPLASVR